MNGYQEDISPPLCEKKSKKMKNPLDKAQKLCYNKYVIKSKPALENKKNLEVDTMATRVVFPFTQKQAFEALISNLRGGALAYEGKEGLVQADADKLVEFLAHKIGQIERQADAPRKLTPQQEANEVIKRGILDNMEVGERYTIGDMLTTFDCFPEKMAPQRVSALLSQLGAKGTGEVVRTEEKGKAYFSLA